MIPLPERIAIFPLSEVVLFPDTLLPLHIFEPRYRRMLADALAGDRVIGMVLLAEANEGETPAVYPVGCAGSIVEHKPFADGRSLVVLKGTVKFRIRREIDTEMPYRIVETQALYEAPPPMDRVRAWRDELRGRLQDLLRAEGADDDTLEKMFDKVDLMVLTNTLCASLPLGVLEKQSLLECATIEDRQRRLVELLVFKTAEARLGLDASRPADA